MKKITKNTVKKTIRKEGSIVIKMLPNKINPSCGWYSVSGWETINSLEELESICNSMLYYMHSEEGTRVAFYLPE